MFDIEEKLLESLKERKEQLETSVNEKELEVAYASLGCTTCEAFTL